MPSDDRLPITTPPATPEADLEFPWFGYDPDCDCPRCEHHRERIAADVLDNTLEDEPDDEDDFETDDDAISAT